MQVGAACWDYCPFFRYRRGGAMDISHQAGRQTLWSKSDGSLVGSGRRWSRERYREDS